MQISRKILFFSVPNSGTTASSTSPGQQSKEWSPDFLRGVLSQFRGELHAWSQRKVCVYLWCFAEPPVTAQVPDISFYGGFTIYPPAQYEREYAAIDQAEKLEAWHRDMVKDRW